ncbi:unnamed protein product [Thelazia callipaeda]|uniref:Helitron_like_N domain-containing protein n=1 Tax=Thelazia callipaeda TaxID=103827 RepID=A0A158RCG4_THECL|nr:unnamed protein product [Thelazia callipaeda]
MLKKVVVIIINDPVLMRYGKIFKKITTLYLFYEQLYYCLAESTVCWRNYKLKSSLHLLHQESVPLLHCYQKLYKVKKGQNMIREQYPRESVRNSKYNEKLLLNWHIASTSYINLSILDKFEQNYVQMITVMKLLSHDMNCSSINDALSVDRSRRMDHDNNLKQFASAINDALRLRYGKRSYDPNLYDEIATFQQLGKQYYLPYYDDFYLHNQLQKRSLSTDRVIASLNGAERLRFKHEGLEIRVRTRTHTQTFRTNFIIINSLLILYLKEY